MPGKLTFWRRRLTAILAVAAIAAGVWVALAGGTTPPTDRGSPADSLPAAQLAGQRLIAGFDGGSPPKQVKAMIRAGTLAGVILFDDNLRSRRHARRLIRSLQRIRQPRGVNYPLLVMVDQEGGLVKRLAGPPNASAEEMGRRGARYSRRQGAKTAESLKEVGVNVNLAPVLDVARPGSVMDVEHRSFGSRPRRVIRTAIPFATAMQDGGVAATGKHFPGLGAASGNTDNGVQKIHLSRAKLRRIDERPYGPFAGAGGEVVMLSTAVYTRFSHRPAIATRSIATGELRKRIGFEGVSVTDALETPSVRRFGGPVRVGVEAAKAGSDLLLYTSHRHAARAASELRSRLRSGRLDRAAFERSVNRVLGLRAQLGG